MSGKLEAAVRENRVKNRVWTGKNNELKSGTYYEYYVIAIGVDPLQKCVRENRVKNRVWTVGKIINLSQEHIMNIIMLLL